MAEIEFTQGPFAGQRLTITADPFTLGSSPDNHVCLEDASVSPQHAQIHIEGNTWAITNLDPDQGTLLNNQSITTSPLNPGDQMQVGESVFAFIPDEAAMAPVGGGESMDSGAPLANEDELALVEQMRIHTENIRNEVGKVIVGQTEVLDQILMCIIAGGHALLIGLPGMAKTLTVRTISQVLNLDFKRVQFTPDLMPGDIVGTDVLETNSATGEKEFRFIKGPIFCNLLLADEINRTPPKTQAALLEAMQEKMVTAGNTSYTLDAPFFVLATQNPVEQEGTYPLPEAQLDRFMFNIWVDYPKRHEEEEILKATTGGKRVEPQAVLNKEDVLQLQSVVRKVPVSDHVIKYVAHLVAATRPQNDDCPEVTKTYISTGAGPRAGQYLILAAKAMAILEGRIHVSCADIRRAAPPVLRHRILSNFAADSDGLSTVKIVEKILEEVPEPDAKDYAGA
ncbi:MAG: AAA family ATPase [Verrucomicrobiota bacterium]